jgi:hypothetical protein
MPTARELLEQADALMRRNRQQAERPPREPAAQGPRSIAPTLVVSPAPLPSHAPEPVPHAAASPKDEDAGIPVLEDAVAAAGDDVPVLTDAVDEIEVAAPDVDEGEASDWLTPPAEDESVLGPSPPSVAVVPPATLAAAPRPHREATPAAVPDLEDLSPSVYADQDADVTVRRAVPALGAPQPAARKLADLEDLAQAGLADLDPDVTWTRPIQGVAVVPPVSARERDAAAPEPVASPGPSVEPPGAPRTLPTGGEFEALAEEIRMQVLQRIDMFTDTGLRERLGERLKPIVDRASADLVAAINQHVGEILRAYVAEAIEREIDRWRAGR